MLCWLGLHSRWLAGSLARSIPKRRFFFLLAITMPARSRFITQQQQLLQILALNRNNIFMFSFQIFIWSPSSCSPPHSSSLQFYNWHSNESTTQRVFRSRTTYTLTSQPASQPAKFQRMNNVQTLTYEYEHNDLRALGIMIEKKRDQ